MSQPDGRPSRQFRFTGIEAARGIAATLVVANHCIHTLGSARNFGTPPFGLLFQFGRSGADLFFVLSGFLIALIHWGDVGRPDRLKHYFARRITRIYPTYWLVIIALIPVDVITHTLYDRYDRPMEVVKAIFLLPQDTTLLEVTWSLRNELLFYVLFGLLILNRAFGAGVLLVWIALMALRPVLASDLDEPWFNLLTYPMNFEFVAGMAAGWALVRGKIARPLPLLIAGMAIFVGFAVAEDRQLLWTREPHLWFAGTEWGILTLRCLGYGTAAVLMIAGLTVLEMRGRLVMPGFLVRLGGASYLLYLIHVPMLIAMGAGERHVRLLRFMPGWLLGSAGIAAIVATALAVHAWIERPLLRAVRPRPTNFSGKSRPALGPPETAS